MLEESLKKLTNIELKLNEDLSRHSTMKLKSRGNLILIKDIETLREVLHLFSVHKAHYRILGNGSNQVLPEQSGDFFIKLQLPFERDYLNSVHDLYTLPASVGLHHLTAHAVKFGLKGWENFTGIPATLGGAIAMNAGTGLGEIGVLVKKVRLIGTDGKLREVETNESSFSYRKNHFIKKGDIVISADLIHLGLDPEIGQKIKNYLDFRNKTQPMGAKSCGCVFKNYSPQCRAGQFLDLLGIKGLTYENIRINPIHANFLENVGDATDSNLKNMIRFIQEETLLYYGIQFQVEIKFE